MTIVLATLAGIGTGVLGGVGHAQGIPPVPTGTTGTTQQPPPPPAPPVVAPGPLGDATTHGSADAARRGAVAADGLEPPLQSLWRQDFDARVFEAVVGDGRAYVLSRDRALRFRGRRVHLYLDHRSRHRMTRVGSARLRGPRRRTGRAVVRFRAPRRVGSRDGLFACIPGVERHGQGAPDPLQTRCGRRMIKY